jgi:hypothetical protein
MSEFQAQNVADDHVFLIGRPPISELLGFISTMAVDGATADQGKLMKSWRDANDHVRDLENTEANIADDAPISDLPSELVARAQDLLASPIAQEAFKLLPTTIKMVELDRLVVYQKYINLAYVRQLQTSLGKPPTIEQIFDVALPIRPRQPDVRLMQNGNAFSFVSPSNDMRFLEARLIAPGAVTGYALHSRPTHVIALAVGFGPNFLNVIEAENRLVLSNGSHRAYALRDAGITHVPCLVRHVSRRDELELTGIADLQQSPDRYLTAPRPPLLKDYFDSRLRMIVPVHRKNRMVRVQFVHDQAEVPAS